MSRNGRPTAEKVPVTRTERSLRVVTEDGRPETRGGCADVPRPCPYARCQYHLAVDVLKCGTLNVNFPGQPLGELLDTCALDAAGRDPLTLEEVAVRMNLTREMVRQIEAAALRKIRRRAMVGILPLNASALLARLKVAMRREDSPNQYIVPGMAQVDPAEI